MAVRVLGPVGIDGIRPLEPRDRMALGVLAVRHGVAVSADQLAEALWGEHPPPSWSKQVQICIGRLRKMLDAGAIETTAGGYRLTLDGDDVDACQFERLVQRGRVHAAAGEHDRAAATYARALSLWRGAPLHELDGWLPGRSEAARLEELHRSAAEDWLDARLAAGEQRDVAAAAEALVNEEPLRERRWAILALAQYRCARQAEALRSLARARRTLAELGVEPGAELVDLERAILRQDPALAVTPDPAIVSAECPYKGLAPYDEGDSEVFFGREAEVLACVDRLRAISLLIVTGPSGCGKSSLVRAGVVPALRRRGRATVVFTPGSDPFASMAEALGATGSPVLVVDQFEELFAQGLPLETVRDFCRALVRYARDTAPVILAVRSDQLGGLGFEAELSSLAEHGLHLVGPLAGDALREAIEQPALLAGLRLEHGLVDLLVRDCEGEPGGLPLLSHALAETWRRRDGQTLTVEGYRSSGGIRGAVARSADRLYDRLSAEQRSTLRSVLLRLVTPTVDGDPVRCRIPSRALLGDPERDYVVGLLVGARLVTSERDTIEIAHEALARAWPRLRSWLDEDVAGQRVLRHLVNAADGWDSLGRPGAELYRGARLETAVEWRTQSGYELTATERAFLDASVEQAASEQHALEERARRDARNNQRLRGLLGALAVLLVVSLIVGVVAVRQSGRAARASDEASARGLAAAALANVDVDPERSVLLALAAVERAGPPGGPVLLEAEEALHRAVNASRIQWRTTGTGRVVAMSPDGVHLVAEGSQGSGRFDVRGTADGARVRSIAGHDDDVTGVAYNDEGSLLATTGADGAARLWDGTSGELLRTLSEPRASPSRGPSFSPDGDLFAAAWPDDDGGLVRIVSLSTGEIVHEIRSPPGAAGTSFSPDGTKLAVSSSTERIAVVIDVATGAELGTLEGHLLGLTDVAWSPDGTSIATAAGDGTARLFDAETWALRTVLPGHGAYVGAVAWSPDSTRLATTSADGTAKIWSLVEGGGRPVITLSADDMRSGFADVAFSADGTQVVTASISGTAAMWDVGLSGGSEIATLPGAGFSFNQAEFTADGRHLLTTGVGGTIGVWDARTWERVRELGGPAAPTMTFGIPGVSFGTEKDVFRIAPSPDGGMVAAIFGLQQIDGWDAAQRLRVWDVSSGEDTSEIDVGSAPSDADWSPDGRILAVAGSDGGRGWVTLAERSGETVTELDFGAGTLVQFARFSHDGAWLIVEILSLDRDEDIGMVEVWDWRRGERVTTLNTATWRAVPSPAGHLVAVGSPDRASQQRVTVWSADTSEQVATLAGHTGGINDLAFSADGSRLAAASVDGTTRIWDATTGDLLLTLGGHLGHLTSVSFSPDGTQLVTAGVDGTIRVWALDLDELVEIAEQRVTRGLTDDECRRYLHDDNCGED
jgi:WD40 repeat protein/DNA-binding SARP family transcriptional activator